MTGLSGLILQSGSEVLERVSTQNSGPLSVQRLSLKAISRPRLHLDHRTLVPLASECEDAGGLFPPHPWTFESITTKTASFFSTLQVLVLLLSHRLVEVDSAATTLDLTTRLKWENKHSFVKHFGLKKKTHHGSFLGVAFEIPSPPPLYLKDSSSLLLLLAAVGGARLSVL